MAGIFKAYDIRGIYGESLDKDMGYQIGLAWSQFIGAGKTIVCGRDGRLHSQELQNAFIEGVLDGGTHVVNMGLSTTPETYYACAEGGFDGSTMITASHNPGNYNGLKFCREKAIPVGYAEGINAIEAAVASGQLKAGSQRGNLSKKSFRENYLARLASDARFGDRQFRFAVDAGNGMAGYSLPGLLAELNQSAQALYWEMDFTFPNHLANPLDFTTLVKLQEVIKKGRLEFGVAFDGDADRCFFVDDQGDVVPADILTALLASYFLKKEGPAAIIYDIRSSKAVEEEVLALGGEPVLSRVGHSFMKAKLREKQGVMGGELAGHFYFRDFYYADGAFFTMIQVMNIINEADKPLSELVAPFKKYVPSGEINFKTDKADQFIAQAPKQFPGGRVNTIDGIRIDFEDWWFCLRKSNTEPLLRLVLEGTQASILREKAAEVQQWLSQGGAVEAKGGH